MARVKKYKATVGLDVGDVRIEAGDAVPDLPPEVIRHLLENGDIEEA